MRKEKIGFSIILRMTVSLLPVLFGMPFLAIILCAYNLIMSYVVFGPLTYTISSISAAAISMLLYGFYFGDGNEIIGLFMAVISIACALGSVFSVRRKSAFFSGVWISSVCTMIPAFAVFKYVATQEGMSVAAMFEYQTKEMFQSAISIVSQELPANVTVSGIPLEKIGETIGTVAGLLVPATIILFSAFISYVAMWAVNRQLRRANYPIVHKFSEIRMPVLAVLMLLASVAACFSDYSKDVTEVSLNISVVLCAFCFFAGFSIVEFFLQKSNIKVFARVLIHFLIFQVSFGTTAINPAFNAYTIYIVLALVDSVFNIRKLGKERSKEVSGNETEN